MLRRIARFCAPLTMTAVTVWAFGGCNGADVTVAEIYDAAPPVFATPEAGAPTPDPALLTYCPSSECPAGFATCADSRFPCDINLNTDPANCGACGAACPSQGGGSLYACVEGRCVLQCEGKYLDCDGFIDNGCELMPSTNENCGGCGVTCTDPDNPCVRQPGTKDVYACGCPDGGLYCPRADECVKPRTDDNNCGGCGIACDPQGDGAPLPNDTVYYGCKNSECGHLKCTFGNADCNDDIVSDGCETRITNSANCGACGNQCPAGQDCRFDGPSQSFQCMCPPGQTMCGARCEGDVCYGECKDLTSDPFNCGGCGVSCVGRNEDSRSLPACLYGSCTRTCLEGWADCNGNSDDSCEVNIDSDPLNCGGCGIVCDAIAGQACVLGRCVVAPCDKDAGGPQ